MRRLLALSVTLSTLFAAPGTVAAAKDAAHDSGMMRVLSCQGDDVRMEVYLPLQLAVSGDAILRMPPTLGYYALDLSSTGKGKPLEPVRVSISPDRKFVIVDQFTRKLPPTRIPIGGGTVDFDQRFATQAKCGAFNSRE